MCLLNGDSVYNQVSKIGYHSILYISISFMSNSFPKHCQFYTVLYATQPLLSANRQNKEPMIAMMIAPLIALNLNVNFACTFSRSFANSGQKDFGNLTSFDHCTGCGRKVRISKGVLLPAFWATPLITVLKNQWLLCWFEHQVREAAHKIVLFDIQIQCNQQCNQQCNRWFFQ